MTSMKRLFAACAVIAMLVPVPLKAEPQLSSNDVAVLTTAASVILYVEICPSYGTDISDEVMNCLAAVGARYGNDAIAFAVGTVRPLIWKIGANRFCGNFILKHNSMQDLALALRLP